MDDGRPSLARQTPVASNGHLTAFAIVSAIFGLAGLAGQLHREHGALHPAHPNVVPVYLTAIVGESFLLFFVWRGMRAYGTDPRSLVGDRRTTTRNIAVDAGLGLMLGLALTWLDAFLKHLLGPDRAASIDPLLPHGPLEVALWVAVSITAGVVEEIVFRGYLLRQLAARSRSVPFAVVAQAAWFAVMHAYEGLHSVISIVAIGTIFGLVAARRRALGANIVAHACIDLIEGIAPRLFGT